MTHKYSVLLAGVLIAIGVMTTPCIIAQERPDSRPDLSGRWELNPDLSDNAQKKIEGMRPSRPAGGHGPGRHGGWLGRIFGGGQAPHAELEKVILSAPTSFVLIQDDQKVVLMEPDGRAPDQKVDISEGATLEVIGSRVTIGESQVVLAREIRKGHKTWILRDAEGQPLWGSGAAAARGFWTTKKVLITVVAAKAALLLNVLRH
jgi:hypothetical protein